MFSIILIVIIEGYCVSCLNIIKVSPVLNVTCVVLPLDQFLKSHDLNKMAATATAQQRLLYLIVIFGISCSYFTGTSGQSGVKTAADICGAVNYDVRNLTEATKGWTYTYKPSASAALCPNGNNSCEFVFAFCSSFNCSTYSNASVCLVGKTPIKDITLATYNNTNIFKAGKDQVSFLASFSHGQPNTTSSCNFSVTVEFDCDAGITWEEHNREVHAAIPAAAFKSLKVDNCQYNFKFSYAGACPSIPIVIDPGKEPLSTGTILIIIFFVSVTAYFILGMTCNMCLGKRGREVLPQSEFWTMMPVYVADGCLFTCRCCKVEEDTSTKYDSI